MWASHDCHAHAAPSGAGRAVWRPDTTTDLEGTPLMYLIEKREGSRLRGLRHRKRSAVGSRYCTFAYTHLSLALEVSDLRIVFQSVMHLLHMLNNPDVPSSARTHSTTLSDPIRSRLAGWISATRPEHRWRSEKDRSAPKKCWHGN